MQELPQRWSSGVRTDRAPPETQQHCVNLITLGVFLFFIAVLSYVLYFLVKEYQGTLQPSGSPPVARTPARPAGQCSTENPSNLYFRMELCNVISPLLLRTTTPQISTVGQAVKFGPEFCGKLTTYQTGELGGQCIVCFSFG